jgi:hypothetical protein
VTSGARASVAEDLERAAPTHSFAVRTKGLCNSDAQGGGCLQLRERRCEPRPRLLPPRELDTDVATRRFVVGCPSQDAFALKNTRDSTPEPKLCIGAGRRTPREGASGLDLRPILTGNYP